MEQSEVEKQVRMYAERYCAKSGYQLNPNEEVLDAVIKGLAMNRIKYGFQYCPCRVVEGDKEKDRLKICPCFWHKEEIEQDGFCHCLLFKKEQ
jgi:ferredoxin-thioredoxin reductase catalytic subunit